ncbi:MAG: GIY-YIG nuclease family protein, partial [Acetobacteraceae bacterium]
MKPRSINIFLLDGDPDGVKVAQIAMSTIQAIAFRRNQLRRVRDTFPEIERPGVYVLIGADETEPGRLLGYIGESEGVGGRLATHSADAARAFWNDTVVLVSKDENLTKSHARYVEASLIRAVGDNPRWTLPNTNRPSSDAGKLPLPDRVAMDEFIDQTKILVGALGWDLFKVVRGPITPAAQGAEAPPAPSPAAAERFSFRGEGFDAEMKIGPSGEIIVTSGSKARLRTTPTIPKGTVAMRQMLQERGVLKPTHE